MSGQSIVTLFILGLERILGAVSGRGGRGGMPCGSGTARDGPEPAAGALRWRAARSAAVCVLLEQHEPPDGAEVAGGLAAFIGSFLH